MWIKSTAGNVPTFTKWKIKAGSVNKTKWRDCKPNIKQELIQQAIRTLGVPARGGKPWLPKQLPHNILKGLANKLTRSSWTAFKNTLHKTNACSLQNSSHLNSNNSSSKSAGAMSLLSKHRNSLPPEDFMGAEKLLAEARFGSANGPLKLGALRTSRIGLSANGWFSFSPLIIIKHNRTEITLWQDHIEISIGKS